MVKRSQHSAIKHVEDKGIIWDEKLSIYAVINATRPEIAEFSAHISQNISIEMNRGLSTFHTSIVN